MSSRSSSEAAPAVDEVTAALAEFSVDQHRLSAAERQAVEDHLVDAIACAVAAIDENPARIARRIASEVRFDGGASVLGLPHRSAPELAAFANATLVRCLDFNDTYNSRTGGHPSDMIGGILAVGEAQRLAGEAVLTGIHVAYEVFAWLADHVPLRDLGWDQGIIVGIGCAAGIAHLLGLDTFRAAHAIALAATANHSLRATRAGQLSSWKGVATPFAVRNAVALTELARLGMTGPDGAFLGRDGFLHRVGGELDVETIRRPGPSAAQRTAIKFLPVEWCAQAPVEAILESDPPVDPAEIERIEVRGYEFLWREIGGGRGDAAAKWNPTTRETADHSLPYLLAVALVDREVTFGSYDDARIADAALRPLMQKITVVEDPNTRGMFPERQPVTMRILLTGGRERVIDVEYPLGHPARPAEPAAVDRKFRSIVAPVAGERTAARILSGLRGLGDGAAAALGDELRALDAVVPIP